jgi:hypothetical protein
MKINLGINLRSNPRFKALIEWNWKQSKDNDCNKKEKIFQGPIYYLFNFISGLFVSFQFNPINSTTVQMNWINSNQPI